MKGVRRPSSPWAVALLLGWAPAALADGGGIAVEASESGCPGRGQVVAALEARLPRVTAAPGGRRLELAAEESGSVTLRLRAADGRVELERALAVDARGPSPEGCVALAEAAALVVVRYLREIGYRPPPVAAPPAPAAAPAVAARVPAPAPAPAPGRSAGYLGVSGAARLAAGDASRGEAMVGFELHRGWLAGSLAAGATTEIAVAIPGAPGADLRLRSFPVRTAMGVPLRAGPGVLVPAVGLAFDLLSFRVRGLADARDGVRVEPAGELILSYLVAGRSLFARVLAAGGLTFGARDFDAGLPEPVFRTPDAYLRAQVELGVVLWKN
jgi:hypothetical protein